MSAPSLTTPERQATFAALRSPGTRRTLTIAAWAVAGACLFLATVVHVDGAGAGEAIAICGLILLAVGHNRATVREEAHAFRKEIVQAVAALQTAQRHDGETLAEVLARLDRNHREAQRGHEAVQEIRTALRAAVNRNAELLNKLDLAWRTFRDTGNAVADYREALMREQEETRAVLRATVVDLHTELLRTGARWRDDLTDVQDRLTNLAAFVQSKTNVTTGWMEQMRTDLTDALADVAARILEVRSEVVETGSRLETVIRTVAESAVATVTGTVERVESAANANATTLKEFAEAHARAQIEQLDQEIAAGPTPLKRLPGSREAPRFRRDG